MGGAVQTPDEGGRVIFTPAVIRIYQHQIRFGRPRILAAHDPLRNVPRGFFTLESYTYESTGLCHAHFANCSLPNLGKVA